MYEHFRVYDFHFVNSLRASLLYQNFLFLQEKLKINKKCLWNIYVPLMTAYAIDKSTLDWIKQNLEVSKKNQIYEVSFMTLNFEEPYNNMSWYNDKCCQ